MQKIACIILPAEAAYVIEKLNSAGFEAFAVGGCVRDRILGRKPDDWDITTNALPEQIKAAFDHTIDTGIKHGTVTVQHESKNIEVTTYRVDGLYEDYRHPVSVKFTPSLKEDLLRRDFTMNAIAYHPEMGIVDPCGGLADINEGIIRAVGKANERFREDALRMLRAIRFSAQLGFRVQEDVLEAIRNNCSLIKNISCERIRDELTKLLVSEYPVRLILLRDTNLLQFVLPEFEVCFHTVQQNPYHIYNVAVHSIKVVAAVENSGILRWAALLHDIAKPLVKTTDEKGIDHFYGHQARGAELATIILKRMRLDNSSIDKITKLILYHDMDILPTEKSVRKAVAKLEPELFEALLGLKEGDRRGQAPEYLEEGLESIRKIREIYKRIITDGSSINMKELAVNGRDLISLGFQQGPELGEILGTLFEKVLEEPTLNTRGKLLELAQRQKK